jgi:YidC/Oxa1 family membrane protein insertase
MDDQNKNLLLATALSFAVILVWFTLFPPPEPETVEAPTQTAEQTTQAESGSDIATVPTEVTQGGQATTAAAEVEETDTAPRIAIDTPRLKGSISLQGGRIDDLTLSDYRETLDEDAEVVTMLKPAGQPSAYYALLGWAAKDGVTQEGVPGPNTLWSVESGDTLTPSSPVTLVWDNGAGLVFRRQMSVDDDYLFSFEQSVENTGATSASLAPYGTLARHGLPQDLKNFFILHEGIVAMTDGELAEVDYDDVTDLSTDNLFGAQSADPQRSNTGWIGFTDHYWMTTLVPSAEGTFRSIVRLDERRDIYQTDAVQQVQTVAPGATASASMSLFAGAKEWESLRDYEDKGIPNFVDSIDWGWFFYLTKPIFWLLHEMNKIIGNMGWAIIGLTLIIKAILFPLAYKSYVSMAKMKELQPEMEKLKERAGEDKQALQKGMMELYKTNKVNPAAGCLPILLQIPIFFSLYKVIFVTIELRQAPWFGPFRDLSAPDPTSILNLFGLLGNSGPEPGTIMALIFIGILPLLLGISMWMQQKLNPAPTDPTQQMIFAWMPWVFMFMLGSFASGLVVYWIANNTITFTQQYLIMRSQGYKPDVFGNIKSSFARKPKPDSK